MLSSTGAERGDAGQNITAILEERSKNMDPIVLTFVILFAPITQHFPADQSDRAQVEVRSATAQVVTDGLGRPVTALGK